MSALSPSSIQQHINFIIRDFIIIIAINCDIVIIANVQKIVVFSAHFGNWVVHNLTLNNARYTLIFTSTLINVQGTTQRTDFILTNTLLFSKVILYFFFIY